MKFQPKQTLEVGVSKLLPSRNVFYGLPETLNVVIRPMTVKEQKQMLQMNGNNAEDVINNIVFSCVRFENGQPLPQNLLIQDRDFLLNEIRKLTYGSNIQLSFACERCNTENKLEYDLEMLDVTYLPDDFKIENMRYKSEFITDENGEPVVFQMMLPTIQSQKQQNMLSKNKKELLIYQGIVANIYGVVTVDIETGEESITPLTMEDKKQLMEVLMNVPAKEVTNILNFMKQYTFDGIQKTVEIECTSCGHTNDVLILNQDFFFPIG